MRVLMVLLLVGLLVSPVLACEKDGGCGNPGGYKDGPAPGHDGGYKDGPDPIEKVCPPGPQAVNEGKDGDVDFAWYVVDQFGRRLSLAYEFRKQCEPQVRALASAGAVKCAWVRR